jgi:hypothetical protein
MAAALTVEVEVRWEPEPGDPGRPCEACGDVPWLGAWRPVAYLVGGPRLGEWDVVLCGACRDDLGCGADPDGG